MLGIFLGGWIALEMAVRSCERLRTLTLACPAGIHRAAATEAKGHFENFRNRFARMPLEFLLPPGYTSRESMKRVVEAKRSMFGTITLEAAAQLGMMVVGSAATVRDRLLDYQRELGFGHLLTLLQFGTLPAELTAASTERFAREVMPGLRAAGEAAAAGG